MIVDNQQSLVRLRMEGMVVTQTVTVDKRSLESLAAGLVAEAVDDERVSTLARRTVV